MLASVLSTRYFTPPPRLKVVARPRLTERLNGGMCHTLTMVSSPAGSGRTTLLCEWIAECQQPVFWLSMTGKFTLRAYIVNFRTSIEDNESLPEIVLRIGREVDTELRPEGLKAGE